VRVGIGLAFVIFGISLMPTSGAAQQCVGGQWVSGRNCVCPDGSAGHTTDLVVFRCPSNLPSYGNERQKPSPNSFRRDSSSASAKKNVAKRRFAAAKRREERIRGKLNDAEDALDLADETLKQATKRSKLLQMRADATDDRRKKLSLSNEHLELLRSMKAVVKQRDKTRKKVSRLKGILRRAGRETMRARSRHEQVQQRQARRGASGYNSGASSWTELREHQPVAHGHKSATKPGFIPHTPETNKQGNKTVYACPSCNPVKRAIQAYKQRHYQRNDLAEQPRFKTVDELRKYASENNLEVFTYSDSQSRYHRYNNNNIKVGMKNGWEYVYDPSTGKIAYDSEDMGTYNHNVIRQERRNDIFQTRPDVLGQDIGNAAGHYFKDVLPYWIWGSTPDDSTTKKQRVIGAQ